MPVARKPYIEGNKAYVSLTLDLDQMRALDHLVTERRTTRAHLMREAIDIYLRLNPARTPLPLPEPLAAQENAA